MNERHPNHGGYRQRVDGAPRVHAGGGFNAEVRPNKTELPKAERKAAARALFEGQPGATCETVAAEVGVPVGTVRRWKAEGGWRPAVKKLPELSARAGALADSFKVKMSELGKPMDDEVAAAEVAREVATDFAVDVRAQVLDRHRKEWAAPRKIAYDAIAKGDFERAKLAKISAETLTLIQMGECRAYGIKPEDKGDSRTVVVVDRESDPVPVSDSGETSTGGAA
jgi:hypothetical protein